MTIEIKEGRFFSRMWFIPGTGVDWMGALWRDDAGGPWIGEYRFRYYTDSKSFGSKDEKSWYKVTFDDSNESTALAAFAMVIDTISKDLGGEVHTLILNTSDPRMVLEAMQREKFCHMKQLDKEEIS